MLVALLLACTGPQTETDTDVGPPAVAFGFPLPERERFNSRIGVDHDPVEQPDTLLGRVTCTDYLGRGYPNCYDQHDGTDIILEGGFEAMDAGSSPIVAAMDGTVVEMHDGAYDHCHPDLETQDITCDGNPVHDANYVILEHENGWRSRYWHMKKDSVLVQVGDVVSCGQPMGLVGSSGYSSLPHLHFEVENPEGIVTDPYAGPFSQEESFWAEQFGPDEWPGDGCAAP